METCTCGHLQGDHEYSLFHGIEDYGNCSLCGCTVYRWNQVE